MRVCLWRVWLIKDSIAINKPCQVLFWNARKFSLLFMQTQRDAAVTCLCFLSLCPTWEVQSCFSSSILLFFFFNLKWWKRICMKWTKYQKTIQVLCILLIQSDSYFWFLLLKVFWMNFFLLTCPSLSRACNVCSFYICFANQILTLLTLC